MLRLFWPNRAGRWLTGLVLAGTIFLVWASSRSRVAEPVYQGRRLSQWLDGQRKEYEPAVRAAGTNALPFLLAELQVEDSPISRLGQSLLGQIEMGPFWTTARTRRYRARLALQILDTHAVPALLDAALARPMRLAEGDLGWEAASALSWLATPEAQNEARRRLREALRNLDPVLRRNGCLAFRTGLRPTAEDAAQLAALTRDAHPAVRAAAVRALTIYWAREEVVLPALLARLDDEQAAIRRLAVEALAARGSNAASALPALRAAYSAALTRPARADRVDDVFASPRALSSEALRRAIVSACRAIDPQSAISTRARSDAQGPHKWIDGLWLFDDGQLERYGQSDGAANGRRRIRSETNGTSSSAGSRR